MPSAFSQLILDVTNLDRSLRFYVGLLQLEKRQESHVDGVRLAALTAGGTRVLLVQRADEEAEQVYDRTGGVVLNFEVRNLGNVLGHLEHHGVKMLRGVERSNSGEASVLVADPDGYAVLLSECLPGLN